jgi:hypothetical protein
VEDELISTPKVMVTLLWNLSDIYGSKTFGDQFFDADYSVQHILRPIPLLQIVTVDHKQKNIDIHMDNSKLHQARVVKLKLSHMPVHLTLDPPNSPDLAS